MPTAQHEAQGRQEARDDGQAMAVGFAAAHDLLSCGKRYPELFPPDPFDDRFYIATAMANAFGSPDEPPERIRAAARMSLWNFAADYLVDHLATERAEVDLLATACRAVADGHAPPGAPSGVPLAEFLAELRDDLAAVPAFTAHGDAWRDQLARYFAAVTREWEWKKSGSYPTWERYLENADNFGSSLVNLTHWISTGDAYTLEHLGELREIGDAVQRVLRLLNDLASYRRELEWGDLNILMLGVTPEQVRDLIAELADGVAARTARLRPEHPRLARYLDRQVGYSTGFYGLTDFWGVPADPA